MAKRKKSGNPEKSRYFSLVTYASEKQLRKVMRDHISSIRAFCYIYHDVDEAEPHFHLLVRTHSTWTEKQIKNWFMKLVDREGEHINTFAEISYDMDALKIYILHQDPDSKAEGKHEYDASQIKEYGFEDLSERKDSYDNSYEILDKYMTGTPARELVRYYGRDFLYHYSHYMEVAEIINHQELSRRYGSPLIPDVTKFELEYVSEMDPVDGAELRGYLEDLADRIKGES